jgi:hypothetical protein
MQMRQPNGRNEKIPAVADNRKAHYKAKLPRIGHDHAKLAVLSVNTNHFGCTMSLPSPSSTPVFSSD